MTYQDYAFLHGLGMAEMDMLGRMLGMREAPGMMRKETPVRR